MATFFSPEGNAEVWDEKPEGYYTTMEWAIMHMQPGEELVPDQREEDESNE